MKKLVATALAVILVAVSGLALARVADFITERQSIMRSNAASMNAIIAMTMPGGTYDAGAAITAFTTIRHNMERFIHMFPNETDVGLPATRALPALFLNRTHFNSLARDLSTAAANAASEAARGALIQDITTRVVRYCGGCHELYRARSM